MDSAFSSASRILVIESGQETAGQWRTEQRSLRQDFERAFGPQQRVPNVVGIGVMTDADNSKGSAVAYFDNLRVSRYRPKAGGG